MVVKVSKPALNLREKLSELSKPSGVAGEAMLRAETPQEQFNLIGAGRRNMLINANMTINQRGTANPVSISANDNSVYPVDRWRTYGNSNATTATINDVVLPNGHRVKSLKTVAGGTGAWLHPYQTVEIESWMAGQTVTLSAWIRTNFTNQAFRICDGAACSLIGDEFPADGQWHYLSVTHVLPNSPSTTHMQYHPGFGGACVANDYIEFACPQMELGKVATPFEYRQIAEELAACQRYFQIYGGATSEHFAGGVMSTNRLNLIKQFPVTMRAAPSLSATLYGGAWSNWNVYWGSGTATVTGTNESYSSISSISIGVLHGGSSTMGGAGYIYANNTNARLSFNAEL